ncbi:MAG: VanZ family protein [Candidatus Binatia bacterium]
MSAVERQPMAAVNAPSGRPGGWAMVAAWLPLALWLGVIFWLSGDQFSDEQTAEWLTSLPWLAALRLPPAAIELANLIVRKSAHFVEYAVLSMLAYRAVGASRPAWSRRAVLLAAVALAVACATVDELHQATTLTRTGSPKDVVIDSLGAFAGALSGAALLYRWTRRRRA